MGGVKINKNGKITVVQRKAPGSDKALYDHLSKVNGPYFEAWDKQQYYAMNPNEIPRYYLGEKILKKIGKLCCRLIN